MPNEGVAITSSPGGSAYHRTKAELRGLVYGVLHDSERNYFEPWFVDEMINEAALDLNARLRIKQTRATGTLEADGTLAVPDDSVEIINLWVSLGDEFDSEAKVELVEDEIFKSWSKPAVDTPYAYIARVFNNTIETYPALNSLDYELEYVQRPDRLEAEDDQFTWLHPELETRLVQYARAFLKYQEGMQEEGDRYMGMYEEGLPGRPRMQYALRPAPMTLFVEPGPFDA